MQHLNAARLWLPDERPWRIKSPKMRPLYDWIRGLYRAEHQLPTMVIRQWVENAANARVAERARIGASLSRNLPLLNVEAERDGPQITLL